MAALISRQAMKNRPSKEEWQQILEDNLQVLADFGSMQVREEHM